MSASDIPNTAKMPPETAVRLLRAKAADLENQVLQSTAYHGGIMRPIDEAKADIALLATLLADHMERPHAV